jgi:hypothetical protein
MWGRWILSFQGYEIRTTPDPGFSASPLVEGERTEVRGLLYRSIALDEPSPSPSPSEGEATGTRAQGRFDFAQLKH